MTPRDVIAKLLQCQRLGVDECRHDPAPLDYVGADHILGTCVASMLDTWNNTEWQDAPIPAASVLSTKDGRPHRLTDYGSGWVDGYEQGYRNCLADILKPTDD